MWQDIHAFLLEDSNLHFLIWKGKPTRNQKAVITTIKNKRKVLKQVVLPGNKQKDISKGGKVYEIKRKLG